MPQVDEVGETLLRAASDVLATDGAAALTVRRIAADAGMSTINVYSRFGSKEGLVEHLYIEGFERLTGAMAAVPTTADPLADLIACGQAYRRFALANPTLYAVMFEAAVPEFEASPAAREVATGTLELLAQRIDVAVRAGLIATTDSLRTAAAIWAVAHGVMSLETRRAGPPGIAWDQVFVEATGAVVRGLMPT